MPFNKTEALRRAEEHLSKREITAAIAIHRMIAQADPYDLTTINALGELYVSVGRTKEAIDDFTRIADGYLNSGSGIKAAYLLRKALDLDPSNAPALIKLGEIYLREGMVEKAHDEFIRAGALLASEGQVTGALQANHRALTAKPGSPQAKAAIAALQADSAASATGLADNKPETGTRGLRSSSDLGAEPARRPAGSMERSPADEESLIQQLSKAEMLVGYGEVDRAIALLREVVNHSPDNLDIHGKLKDIYLRNEMIREAALECLELARIHEARGESARATEYTMRAGRLGQPTGRLANKPPSQAPVAVASLAKPTVTPHSGSDDAGSGTPEPSLLAEQASRDQAPSVSPGLSSAAVDPEIRREGESEPVVAPLILRPSSQAMPARLEAEPRAVASSESHHRWAESRTPSAYRHAMVADRAAANLRVRVTEPPAIPGLPESTSERTATRESSNSLAAPLGAELLRVANTAPIVTRKRLPIAAMALVGGLALTLGTIKGISMYGAQLDQEYEELAISSSSESRFSPPGLPSSEDLQPRAEQESVKIDSPQVPIVTPSGPVIEKPIAADEAPPGELVGKSAPSSAGEQTRTSKSAATPPPTAAVTDQRGGEILVPRGLPTGAPQSFAPGPSPPPAAPAPQRAIPVIKGEAIRQAQPDYPAIARSARQEGTVPVEISINEKGDVVSARAISGPVLLRGPAESAARRWKFKPSTRDGRPLPTVTTINFRFKL
jgi:protein TonB